VEFERDAGDLGEDFARQVVLSRAEPAGDDDEIRPITRMAENVEVGFEVVCNGRVKDDIDANLGKLGRQPLAVGVESDAATELATDGNDFRFHRIFPKEERVFSLGHCCFERANRLEVGEKGRVVAGGGSPEVGWPHLFGAVK
jgi:hypothetical protein